MPFVSRYRRFAAGLRPVAKLLACGALLCLSIIVATAVLVVQQRQRAMAETERELRNISLVLSEELDRSFQALEIVQTAIIDHMRTAGIATEADYLSRMSGTAVHDMLQQQIAGLPHVDAITLISRDGRLINFSRYWPIPKVVVTDRDYFKALAADPKLQSFVSEPVQNRGTGTWTIYIARRFTAPDGSFLGLVLGAMRLAYFERFYQSIALGPDSSIAMFRQDGILLARYPHIDPQIGRSFAQTTNFQRLLNALGRGMVRQISTMDGKDRLMASHRVPHFPVVTVVTTTTATALADWRRQVVFVSIGAALMVAVIAGIVLAIVRQIRAEALLHQARSAQQQAEVELRLMRERAESARALQVQYARFDAALNNMLQGLAMFDRDNNLLVCNRRCLGMLGIDESQAPPGIHFDRMLLPAAAAGKVTPQDLEALVQQVTALAADGAPGTFVWQLANDTTLSVSYQPMEDTGWLVTFENITARRQAEAQIAYLAHHDALTGLPNRTLFRRKLHETLAHSLRGKGCAVLCLDLDRFKRVNDTLGHPIGDGLLKAVTARILDCIRETDTAARLGGDEFVIVQTALGEPVDATVLASRLIEALSEPFQVDGHQVVIGASVGIAFAPQDGSDPDQLLKSADMALYRAKVDGRGVYRLFHAEMDAEMQARRALELDLRAALRTGQFALYFQPLIDLRTRGVTGFEALLRWQHPKRGLVTPAEFIPLAEEIGLIVPLGEWVLQHACRTAMTWPEPLKVAVNISPIQFRSASLVAAVALALRASGLPPSRLELEITEAVLLHDTDSTLAILHALRELGVAIVMDDFGTGYSSLSYLRQFPFSKIKIDQSFVRDLQSRKDCAAIVRAVASLGIDLGMNTTAEGVETPEQLAALAEAGCTTVQGFMFSPPRPAEEVIAELERLAPGRDNAAPSDLGRLLEKLASAAD